LAVETALTVAASLGTAAEARRGLFAICKENERHEHMFAEAAVATPAPPAIAGYAGDRARRAR
jgi:hypothetical protein